MELKPEENNDSYANVQSVNASGEKIDLTDLDVIKNVAALIICMAIGAMVSGWIGKLIGMSFPSYVGAMFIAVIAYFVVFRILGSIHDDDFVTEYAAKCLELEKLAVLQEREILGMKELSNQIL